MSIVRRKHFVVDFDGVFTSGQNVIDGNLVRSLVEFARHGDKIDVVTGQIVSHLEEVALPQIRKAIGGNTKLWEQFRFGGENGVDQIVVRNGRIIRSRVSGVGLTPQQIDHFKRIFHEKAAGLFPHLKIYADKKSTFTVDVIAKPGQRDDSILQPELDKALEVYTEAARGMPNLAVRRTLYSVDISDKNAEKDMVGRLILREEARRPYNKSTSLRTLFIGIGDSSSDALLVKAFHDAKAPYQFYFVGRIPKTADVKGQRLRGITQLRRTFLEKIGTGAKAALTDRKFSEGTRKVLGVGQRKAMHKPKRAYR